MSLIQEMIYEYLKQIKLLYSAGKATEHSYRPAQKWVQDRNDQEFNFDNICHSKKIIVALTETDCIMKQIDQIVTF
jgi:hypothetical protein